MEVLLINLQTPEVINRMRNKEVQIVDLLHFFFFFFYGNSDIGL